MYAAVDVGVYVVVLLGHGIHHTAGFLRGGSVVEIDEWFVIYSPAQDGKILSDALYVVGHILSFGLQNYKEFFN